MSRILLVTLLLGCLTLGCDQGNNGNNAGGGVSLNQPPGITSTPTTTATTFIPYTYQLTSVDPEGDLVFYALEIFPDGMTLSSSGLIEWTPTFEQIGPNFVKIQATDGQHDPSLQSFFIDVLEGPPMLSFSIAVDPATFIIGDPDITITATGIPTGGTITFSSPNNGGTSGLFSFPVAVGSPTSNPATFSFGSAEEGGVATVDVTFTPPTAQDPITQRVQILVRFNDGTFTYRSNPNLEIPESGGGPVSDTLPVLGFTGTVTNMYVLMNLPNTYAGDLQIFLTHEPSATQVELTTGNGGGGFNFFAPVIFDDAGINGSVLSISTSGGRYIPENPLSTFNGIDPNGDWTLQIEDVLGIDVGILLTWILVFEGNSLPPLKTFGTSYDLENSINSPSDHLIANATVFTSTIPVSFAPTTITDVRLKVALETPTNTELTVSLTSPFGNTVVLSTNNGTGNDMGVIFDDNATTSILSFTETLGNPEPFPSFFPENSMAPLLIGDPNGNWTLTLTDAGGDGIDSILRSWYIAFNGDNSIF